MSLGEPKEKGGKERAPAGQEEGAQEREGTAETQDWQHSRSQHSRRGQQSGVKYSERKSGKSGVRARRDQTQPAATGGRCGARGGGAARELPPSPPQGCVRAAVAKWESAQRGRVVEAVVKGAQRNPGSTLACASS